MNTLIEFKSAVDLLDDVADAYDIFEDDCTDDLRDEIYNLSDSDTPEPFRSAMRNMGYVTY